MIFRAPDPTAQRVVFCLAHAGGSAASYRGWPEAGAAHGLDIASVELPGHGRRLLEPVVADLAALIDVLHDELTAYAARRPFALLGHSMGAIIAFALALQASPIALFVSASRIPGSPLLAGLESDDDGELRETIERLSGTPTEVLDEPEMMELILPTLRADMRVVAGAARLQPYAVTCPIRAYGADDDPLVSGADLERWRVFTSGAFSRRMFSGGHFFAYAEADEIIADLAAGPWPVVAKK